MPLSISLESIEELRTRKLIDVYNKYYSVCNCVDPESGKVIYVDCVVNSVTYRMNAGKEAAKAMDEGVRIFERSGATAMPVVRDFNNVNHTNVPIADAISISLQQGADAMGHWQSKGVMVDAITAATTAAELLAVDLTFTVNTI